MIAYKCDTGLSVLYKTYEVRMTDLLMIDNEYGTSVNIGGDYD